MVESANYDVLCVKGRTISRGGDMELVATSDMRNGGQLGLIDSGIEMRMESQVAMPDLECRRRARGERCGHDEEECEQAGPSLLGHRTTAHEDSGLAQPRCISNLCLPPSPQLQDEAWTPERPRRGDDAERSNFDIGDDRNQCASEGECGDFEPIQKNMSMCDGYDNVVLGTVGPWMLSRYEHVYVNNHGVCYVVLVRRVNTFALISLACANLGMPAQESAGVHVIYSSLCLSFVYRITEIHKISRNGFFGNTIIWMHPIGDTRCIIQCGLQHKCFGREGVFDSEYPYTSQSYVHLLIHISVCMCILLYTCNCTVCICIVLYNCMSMNAHSHTEYELYAFCINFGSSAIALD